MAISVNQQGLSFIQYLTDGVAANFPFTFTYLNAVDIKVYVNSAEVTYTYLNASEVTPDVLPLAGDIVTIRRFTEKDMRIVNFEDGAQLSESILDLNSNQIFFLAQETQDISNFGLGVDPLLFTMDARGYRIINVGNATELTDGTNLSQLNAVEDAAIAAGLAAQATADAAVVTAGEAVVSAAAAQDTADAAVVTANGIAATAASALSTANAAVVTADAAAVTAAGAVTTANAISATATSALAIANAAIPATEKGASEGVATLVSGKVPAGQLPTFVDDVVEYANLASLPVTGDSGKIYVTLDDNKTLRWTGSTYVQIGGAGGISEWITSENYVVGNIVVASNKIYKCLIDHSATVFATDLADNKWIEVSKSSVDAADVSGVLPVANGGTNSSTALVNGKTLMSSAGALVESTVEQKDMIRTLTSGLITGGIVSINADTTKFDITAGSGVIIDNWTDPLNPVVSNISWSAQTAITTTYLATDNFSYVGINSAGAVQQFNSLATNAERRDIVVLVKLAHTSRTVIANIVDIYDASQSPVAQLRDLFEDIRYINIGNVISANGANLSINKTAGSLTGKGVNYKNNIKDPNKVSLASSSPVTLQYRTQTGVSTANATVIDPANYDVAGTITAIAGGGNTSTNQRVYLFPNGNVRIQYGQVIYPTMAAAMQGFANESFTIFENIALSGILIGIITVRKGATTLNSTTDAMFTIASKFGELSSGATSGGTTTLQQAYANAATPEITTDTTNGAVDIKRGSAADTDDVMRILNAAGLPVSKLNAMGRIDTMYSSPDNMIRNGSFEFVDLSDWTCTVGTCTRTTTSGEFSHGGAALKVALSAQSMNVSQTITTPSGIQKQGVVGFIYRIPATGIVTPTVTITVDSVLQVTVPTDKLIMDGLFHSLEVPILFGATDIKLSFLSGSSTGSVFFDGVYVKQGIGFQNLQLDDVYSAQISSTGVVSSENKDWLASGPFVPVTTSVYTLTINAGIFTVAPNCTATSTGDMVASVRSTTPTSVTVWVGQPGVANIALPFYITCQKSGNDYLAASAQVYSQAMGAGVFVQASGAASAVSANAPIILPTITSDTTNGAYSTTTGLFAVTQSGYYDVTAGLVIGTIAANTHLYVSVSGNTALGGNTPIMGTALTNAGVWGRATVYASSGQTISIRLNNSGSSFGSTGTMSIQKAQGNTPIVGSFENVPTVPNAGKRIDIFSVSYGTTNATTVCSGTPCFIDQIGTAVSQVTRASAGSYSMVTGKTYIKLKCVFGANNPGAYTFQSSNAMSCSNCISVSFNTANTAGAAIDVYGNIMCQGTY